MAHYGKMCLEKYLVKKIKNPLVKGTEVMIYYESLSGTRGSWRNWLAHWTVDPGVAGSSPVDPASTGGSRDCLVV